MDGSNGESIGKSKSSNQIFVSSNSSILTIESFMINFGKKKDWKATIHLHCVYLKNRWKINKEAAQAILSV
jgi:hypothetical protein